MLFRSGEPNTVSQILFILFNFIFAFSQMALYSAFGNIFQSAKKSRQLRAGVVNGYISMVFIALDSLFPLDTQPTLHGLCIILGFSLLVPTCILLGLVILEFKEFPRLIGRWFIAFGVVMIIYILWQFILTPSEDPIIENRILASAQKIVEFFGMSMMLFATISMRKTYRNISQG